MKQTPTGHIPSCSRTQGSRASHEVTIRRGAPRDVLSFVQQTLLRSVHHLVVLAVTAIRLWYLNTKSECPVAVPALPHLLSLMTCQGGWWELALAGHRLPACACCLQSRPVCLQARRLTLAPGVVMQCYDEKADIPGVWACWRTSC